MPTATTRHTPSRGRRRTTGVATALVVVLLGAGCAGSEGTFEDESAGEPAAVVTTVATAATGADAVTTTIVASASAADGPTDDGFLVRTHGFSFENYGDDDGVANLLPGDVARMFGSTACASGVGDGCLLTPPAQAWLEQMNELMAGGHCEGMAVLSLLMQQGRVDPTLFGGPDAASLTLTGNEKLQREIAFWFATQAVSPTSEAALRGGPTMVVDRLRAWFAADDADGGYTLGIYKPDGADGHAVTPVGIEDAGAGRVDILVYDNNHPGEVRRIEVDTAADSWRYVGSTNPDEEEAVYEGDVGTESIELTPLGIRLTPQAAPFLDGGEDGDLATKGSAAGAARTEVFLDPAAFRNGVRVSVQAPGGGAVAGVTEWRPRGADLWDVDVPPVLRIPVGQPFELVLDASAATGPVDTDLAVIGGGFDAGVDGILLEPGQRDVVWFDPATTTLRYTTTADESPTLTVSLVTPGADYDVVLAGVELGAAGGTLETRLDRTDGRLFVRSVGGGSAVVLFEFDRYTDQGSEGFVNDGVELAPGERLVLDLASWAGDATSIPVGIDMNGDGVTDETFELADES